MKPIFRALAVIACIAAGCRGTAGPRPSPDPAVTYRNADYGLTLSLPPDWRGYSVLRQQWESRDYDPALDREVIVGRGPVLVLRHPLWRPGRPRQDIPVLVFTRDQWQAGLPDGTVAGGIIYEISHNERYVFGIHSRFNADDTVEGSAEAGKIADLNEAASTHLAER